MEATERLRAAVFASPRPAESPLLKKLLAAEATMAAPAATPGLAGGVLWRTATTPTPTPAPAQSHRGPAMGPDTTGLTVTVLLRMAHLPTSIVHLLEAGQHPLVSLRVHNGRTTPARLRLTSFVEGYSAHAVDTVEIAPGQQAEISHLPTFFPDRLASLSEVCRASLHIQIDDLDGKLEQERTFPIWMLARTSALLHVPDPATGLPRDLMPYLAAWVTPSVPAVFALLRQAAASLTDGTVASYQMDAAGVQAQVKAIYDALKGAGITYVNSVLCFGAIPGVLAQRIRLPTESLTQRSANCMDGTVLLASVLEAASLHPALVLIPGHAFLGWETSEGSGQWDYLETTLLGSQDFAQAQAEGRALAAMYEDQAILRPAMFSRLSLRALRARGIWPME